jgi:hypothetical protein
VSDSELGDLIDLLLDKQLVREAESPAAVVALDPSLALEAHMARAEREMAQQEEAFAKLRMQLPQLADNYESGRLDAGHLPGFEIIASIEETDRQIDLMVDRIQQDVRSLEHLPPMAAHTSDSPQQIDLLRRGVRDRLIVSPQVLSRSAHTVLEKWGMLGHETRTLPIVTTRLKIYDHELAILPVDANHMSLGAIFIRVRSVVDLLCLQWDYMWSIATPLFTEAHEASAPTGRTARVLELLLLGTTDERMARTLGVGTRTIRREVATLKTDLAVSSRPEIGAAAIRRGWLPPSNAD